MWWIVVIFVGWLVVGTFAALWIGRAINRADLEESAAEQRRAEKRETQPDRFP